MTGRYLASCAARGLVPTRAYTTYRHDVLCNLQRPIVASRPGHLPKLPHSHRCHAYSTSNTTTEGTTTPPRPKKSSSRILIAGLLLTGTVLYFTSSSSSSSPESTTLNGTTFAPYTISERVAMSPSSFVLTVSPNTPNPDPPYLLPSSNRWRHPLWSVEFKQPEVQISRHYTPLPPEGTGLGVGAGAVPSVEQRDGSLRFYIRAIGEGEMSRYLSRLREGNTVWLRGPHVGFDIIRRLGGSKNIVFLAGGTGVVPGMQAARVVLDGYEDSRVSLLWAVRKREEIQSVGGDKKEAQGPPPPPQRSWWDFKTPRTAPAELDVHLARPSPVAAQLAGMKAHYGDRLSVQVVVDEENTSFDNDHIHAALTRLSSDNTIAAPAAVPTPDPTGACSLHNQGLHEQASEFESDSPICCCSPTDGVLPGKNLFVVSGPEGFVRHYAGEKVWAGGRQTQGPVGGVVAALQSANPRFAQEWLILKL